MTETQTEILIQKQVALAPLTTLKVGGAARFFVKAETETEVLESILWAKENSLPLFVLGGGSNVLIADRGFNGLVLQIALKGVSVNQKQNNVLVTAQAGEDWDSFVKFCVEKNLQGVECLSGIPGTVGGTPVQNVGAYGQEVSETIVSAKVLERESGKVFAMSNAECSFTYRTSIFNTTHKDKFIVLAVSFRLKPNGEPKIVYKDLREFFGDKKPSLRGMRKAVLKIRAAKSMVIDPRDSNSKSAGSFFKNPIVTKEKFAEVKAKARDLEIVKNDESIPHFKVSEETIKIPAAWLIEKSGFYKGFKFGQVGISTNHSLAIVNLGGATAHDILTLKNEIQKKVERLFSIMLTPEPIFIGFEES